eukprot:234356-Pyramimonas_sp.AAC.1
MSQNCQSTSMSKKPHVYKSNNETKETIPTWSRREPRRAPSTRKVLRVERAVSYTHLRAHETGAYL